MKLKSFRVTNFQSVIDSTPIEVGDITCLVGKNEAGKTALLRALYKLNPVRPADAEYSVTDDYPRAEVTAYEARVKRNPESNDCVVTATYLLDEDECAAIGAVFGDKFLLERELSLSKFYPNKPTFNLKSNDQEAIKYLIAKLPMELKKAAQDAKNAADLLKLVQPHSNELSVAAIVPILSKTMQNQFSWYAVNVILAGKEPKYLYFDEYYQMRGCENINALLQRKAENRLLPSDEPLLGLVEIAGIELQDMLNTQRTQELKNRLQGASVHLTKQILPYWSQNKHLQLQFDIRQALPQDPPDMRAGHNIWGEVYDTRQFASTALGARSKSRSKKNGFMSKGLAWSSV